MYLYKTPIIKEMFVRDICSILFFPSFFSFKFLLQLFKEHKRQKEYDYSYYVLLFYNFPLFCFSITIAGYILSWEGGIRFCCCSHISWKDSSCRICICFGIKGMTVFLFMFHFLSFLLCGRVVAWSCECYCTNCGSTVINVIVVYWKNLNSMMLSYYIDQACNVSHVFCLT